MGNVTTGGAEIWTPDENDNLDPEVWSAAMAQSIEDGLGQRVAKQERFEGAFLNIQDPFTMTAGDPGHTQVPLPFEVGAGVCYVSGDMTLNGGYLKVVHPGLYTVAVTISGRMASTDPNAYLELTAFKNGSRHGQDVTFKDSGAPSGRALPSLQVSTVMKCVEGDVIWASGAQYFGDYAQKPTLNVDFNLFNTMSVALTQAF